jgi:AcrR family transcriptional regulator
MGTLYANLAQYDETAMTKDDTASASFGGSAVAARSMELLWGTKPPPSRGRRPGMTVERIVVAAVELADADGMDGVSMRRVADRLGVGTMSLYRYVPSKAELQDLMLDAAIGEAPPVHEAGHWRAGLERFARASLEGYRRHPWLLRASLTRGAMGPHQAAALDSVLRVIDGIGLSGGERMSVVGLVTGYVRGVAQQLTESTRVQRRTGVSDEQFWTDFAPLLDEHLDAGRYPALTALWRNAELDWVEPFEFGLRRVLDGIAALVESRS